MRGEKDKDPTYLEQLAFIGPEEWGAALTLADRLAAGEEVELLPAQVLRAADSAVDIAMFGRMLADDPDFNREAAVQVAHAITTHRVVVEDDYYTAVDDLKRPSEDAGAGFIGEAGFGSGVFYLYLCIDRSLLERNLGGDAGLAGDGIAALVEAAATVSPRGKQASYASRARTSFILAEQGGTAPRTLAAAFLCPVRVEDRQDHDVLAGSIEALLRTRGQLARAYDDDPEHRMMSVPEEKGSLAEVIAFARGP
jgi:CRISPR system Cascade subunit CasC